MTLLATFKTLVARHTGEDDIVMGSPIGIRDQPELEGMMGCFINTLVLRTDLSGNPTFLELLRRVRDTALDAYDHPGVLPLERIVGRIESAASCGAQSAFPSPVSISGRAGNNV